MSNAPFWLARMVDIFERRDVKIAFFISWLNCEFRKNTVSFGNRKEID